ncbi:ISL3 family transposase [Candidatus Desantisbacteria bacterium CG_4_10_14_0_8_um_filter_48_22]|uniref:ISL3 family transposase n=1 Tax=Candidatus Desantisbacteria bacterium CG_4_10_14_0_8_um_filter_48_22 TaxID=1974543 RepID=A0A2M7S825_9BACT|nr:MAG: ISL3 family transposase [Candidatus Desantisbacteria bacterium CG_4_10_14_0_8_um_filter_48_22]
MISQEEINRLIDIPGHEAKEFHFEQQGLESILHIVIEKTQSQYRCVCGYTTNTYYDSKYLKVRDLPYGRWKIVYLWFKKYRIECPNCGVKTEVLSWLDPRSRCTKRLADEIALTCRNLRSISDVAREYRMSWDRVKDIDKKAMEKDLNPPDFTGVRVIAVDELSIKKGHKYATRVIDLERRRTLWVSKDRSEESLDEFYKLLGEEGCSKVAAVAIDEHKPYIASTSKNCPQATIVYDEFHILNNYGKVIDKVRNQECLKAGKQKYEVIKGSKYLLLSNRENLDHEKRIRLQEILNLNRRIYKVYVLKDDLKHLWSFSDKGQALEWFKDWYRRARYSRIDPLKKFACGLKEHIDGILAHCTYKINTSVLEGMNNMAKVIKRIAFGFRDTDYFFLKLRAHNFTKTHKQLIPFVSKFEIV